MAFPFETQFKLSVKLNNDRVGRCYSFVNRNSDFFCIVGGGSTLPAQKTGLLTRVGVIRIHSLDRRET